MVIQSMESRMITSIMPVVVVVVVAISLRYEAFPRGLCCPHGCATCTTATRKRAFSETARKAFLSSVRNPILSSYIEYRMPSKTLTYIPVYTRVQFTNTCAHIHIYMLLARVDTILVRGMQSESCKRTDFRYQASVTIGPW